MLHRHTHTQKHTEKESKVGGFVKVDMTAVCTHRRRKWPLGEFLAHGWAHKVPEVRLFCEKKTPGFRLDLVSRPFFDKRDRQRHPWQTSGTVRVHRTRSGRASTREARVRMRFGVNPVRRNQKHHQIRGWMGTQIDNFRYEVLLEAAAR